ncbi:MAG: hypothetical protein MOGMAGMI_02467 [Candidatus Omnitrophica bacterium]|nr:hypothetical protein [Candidatus Omnitrophota bacterium]
MQQALDQLRQVIAAPTAKGLIAAASALWAGLTHHATDSFLISFGAVALLYSLDCLLGTWQAIAFGEFNKAKLSRFVSKALAYTGVSLCAFVAGIAADVALSADTLAVAYSLTTAANVMLAGTEGVSVLGHVDKLTDGALADKLGWLRPMLEQMRDWTPTVKPKAAPNGGP